MLAKAVANETDATFIKMAGSELVRKFIGEGSRLVRDLFEMAREREPAIIFIDEIDAIATRRIGVQDLRRRRGPADDDATPLGDGRLRGSRCEIRIIAATNRFDMLDRAILRPGRFDRLIEVPEPSEGGPRADPRNPHPRNERRRRHRLRRPGSRHRRLPGADIESLAKAGMFAIRNDRNEVTHQDFADALEKIEKRRLERRGLVGGLLLSIEPEFFRCGRGFAAPR